MSAPIQDPTPTNLEAPAKAPCNWGRGPSGIGRVTPKTLLPKEMRGATWQCPRNATWNEKGETTSDYCGFHSILMGTRDPVALDINIEWFFRLFALGYFFGFNGPDGAYLQPPWWAARHN